MPIGSTPLNDGHHIPNLAFGTGSALKGKDAQDAVTAALHAGFRHIDTAQFYRNEESVGNGLWAWLERGLVTVEGDVESNARSAGPVVVRRPKREDVWVTTKLGDGDKGALEELKESLRKLRLDYVDLYLIHGPWLVKGRVEVVWREMEQAREFGLAKSIGVSNFDATELYKLLKMARIKPAVNQIHLHPYIYQTSLATLQFCKNNGIAVEAYGSLYPITQLPDGPVTPTLKRLSERLGASLGQVLFLWVRAKECVVITTTNREERLREYLGIGELGPLTEDEVRKIDEAAASLYPRITSHIYAPFSVVSDEEEFSRPRYHTAASVNEQIRPSSQRRKMLACLLYGGIMFSMHCLRRAAQYYGPPGYYLTVMGGLNAVVYITCVVLWHRALRKKFVVEEQDGIEHKG